MTKAAVLSLLLIIPLVAFASVVTSPSHSRKTEGSPQLGITIEPLKMHSLVDEKKMPTQEISDFF
jgi:hypothetical protein